MNSKIMTTLTLQIENPSVLAHLKEVLKTIHGVNIIETSMEEVPNAITLAAMKEAENGNDAGAICMDSLDSFIASMQ